MEVEPKTSNSLVSENCIGGRLESYLKIWKNMTSDKAILEMINGIKIDFVDQPVQYRILKEIKCSNNEKLLIDIEIEKYIKQDIIHKVYHSENEFISQIFLRLRNQGVFV